MRLMIFITLITFSSFTLAEDGLIRVKSVHSVNDTMDKLENTLKAKGMKIFTRIDHHLGAKSVDLALKPIQVLIFGNPKVGSKLMQCNPSVGIDLPQKVLVNEDEQGQVWLSYNDPNYLVKRHAMAGCEAIIAKIETALANFSKAATQ